MNRFIFLFLICSLIFFTGCERNLNAPTYDINGLQITAGENAFTIRNGTDQELHLVLMEQETSASTEWVPLCLSSGHILSPGETSEFVYVSIYGYKENCQVIVSWWACVQQNGALAPGEVQHQVVSTVPK